MLIIALGSGAATMSRRKRIWVALMLGSASIPACAALPACTDPLFVDAIAEGMWITIDLVPADGTGGIRTALNRARDEFPGQPVRIRLAPGVYADTLGGEIFAQRLLRTASTPVLLVAADRTPNATRLGQGINLLGVSYVAIDGVTIGPPVVGAWNGTVHAAPLPLQAAAGVHVSGAAIAATANGAPGGTIDYGIYGRYEPSHHIVVRNVTVQNLFEPTDFDAETSQGNGFDGIKFNQVTDAWVLDSRISQTTRHGIDNVGVHRAAFCRNTVARTGGGLGIEAKGGAFEVLYDSNVFHRVRRVELGGEDTDATYYYSADLPSDPDHYRYEGRRIVARNNLIVDAREAALEFSGCLDCAAVGNTILFTSGYVAPSDGGTVFGGDGIRVHDSRILGAGDGAGSDCQTFDSGMNDYVTVSPCWGVGSNAPAPVNRVLAGQNVAVIDTLVSSVTGSFSDMLGGSVIPCPLNVINGSAALQFDGNYWFNGPRALPDSGCTALPDGINSVLSTTAPVPPPLLMADTFDAATLATLAANARIAATPTAGSPLGGRAIAHPDLPARDALGTLRSTPATIGAIETSLTVFRNGFE